MVAVSRQQAGDQWMRREDRSLVRIRRLGSLVAVPAAAMVLAACGGMMQQAEAPAPMTMATVMPPPEMAPAQLPAAPPPPVVQMMPQAVPTPTPGIAARERFQLAINALQQGDSQKAAVELRAYLAEVPNSTPARNLLAQIETPLEMLYPAESFTVQLQPQETLSSLAGIYLGDVLAFYGLARYNMIQNPARVSVGQTIRIPSTPATLAAQANRASMGSMQASLMPMPMPMPPPAAAAPAPPPPVVASAPPPPPAARPAPPRDPWISIRENVAAGRFDAAIRDAETARVTPNGAQAVILASAYAGNARAIQMSNAMDAAAQALRAGQLYLETANRPADALAPLELAVMLAPMDNRAQMLLTTAKTRVTDAYYREGVALFQRQDLDGAIAAWDRALAVDPNHRNAQLNRAQAIELKQNLQRLK
jgi:tetratricopeptide (TPR) repeat protein